MQGSEAIGTRLYQQDARGGDKETTSTRRRQQEARGSKATITKDGHGNGREKKGDAVKGKGGEFAIE